ncbi:MAG: ClpXP protease specificity-enhancing factor [Ottowia sp.]|nr:ClpXP protease specificity-enhancing factor [Ottowia sp.]
MTELSTKPYVLRALYDWCVDSGYTPYIAVFVNARVRGVPQEFVKNDEVVLNISFEATSQLDIGKERIVFSARFSGVAYDIEVPLENVLAIYAQENGQGMAFPVARGAAVVDEVSVSENLPTMSLVVRDEGKAIPAKNADTSLDPDPQRPTPTNRPHLKVVK